MSEPVVPDPTSAAAPPPAATPAGWYPDPNGAPVRRWWDGQRWGDFEQIGSAAQPPIVAVQAKNGLAVAGLVFGILALAVNTFWISSILGIIFSSIGLSRANTFARSGFAPIGKTQAAWGLALAIAGGVKTIFFVGLL